MLRCTSTTGAVAQKGSRVRARALSMHIHADVLIYSWQKLKIHLTEVSVVMSLNSITVSLMILLLQSKNLSAFGFASTYKLNPAMHATALHQILDKEWRYNYM